MADSVFSDLLTMTVSIQRKSAGTVDEWNIPAETFSTISSSTACLIQPSKETLEIERRGKKEIINVIGYFEYAASILEDDIITYNTKKYVVVGIENAGGQNHHLEVLLKVLEN